MYELKVINLNMKLFHYCAVLTRLGRMTDGWYNISCYAARLSLGDQKCYHLGDLDPKHMM